MLNQTPPDKLEAALAPMLDIDGALKFLALETVLVNNDGYWVRASDYSIYLDPAGKFHIIPHDANETFAPARWSWRPPRRLPAAAWGAWGPGDAVHPARRPDGGPGGTRWRPGGPAAKAAVAVAA